MWLRNECVRLAKFWQSNNAMGTTFGTNTDGKHGTRQRSYVFAWSHQYIGPLYVCQYESTCQRYGEEENFGIRQQCGHQQCDIQSTATGTHQHKFTVSQFVYGALLRSSIGQEHWQFEHVNGWNTRKRECHINIMVEFTWFRARMGARRNAHVEHYVKVSLHLKLHPICWSNRVRILFQILSTIRS